jgi:putative peptide zinc metalloprotease protein
VSRRLAAGLLAPLLALALVMPAGAENTGNDNTAIAVNTKDGSSLFKFSFRISRVMSDTVDSGNAAVAYASCTDCQTTALAIQFVLLLSDPSTFTPENLALAINENCELCDTLASAYQFVIQAGGPVHLSGEGMRQLQEIRRQLAALKDSGLSSFELQAKIDELTKQAYQVVLTSLVPAGRPDAATADTGATDTPTTSTTEPPSNTTSTTDEPTTSTTSTTTESSTTTTSAP